MTDRRSGADLGPSAEAALSSLPFPERDWESDARAIEVRLQRSTREATDAALLLPPLPREPGEGSIASASTTPVANSGVRQQSLAELARRSVEKRQSSERERARMNLVVNTEPASASAATQQHDSLPQSAVRQQHGGSTESPAANVSHRQANVAHLPVSTARVPGAAPIATTPPIASTIRRNVALGVSAFAIAAGAWLWFGRAEPAAPLSTNSPGQSEVKAAPPAVPTSAPAPAADEGDNAPHGVDPSTLPSENSGAVAAEATGAKAAGLPLVASATSSTAPGQLATSKVRNEAQRLRAASPETPNDKTLPPDPALRPAESSAGEMPVKPSTGAAQAALGAVMSGARHCVAGDDGPSSAVVLFGSDGRVQRVTVTGPAAGKSSAACIEAQLSRARVQPFAAPNFSVSATVRPE